MAISRDLADLGSTLFTGSANLSIDSGTLFIDSVNNRVGVGNTSPGSTLTVQGSLATTTNVMSVGTAMYVASNGSLLAGTSNTIGNGGQLQLYGYNQVGGTGYHGFLALENSYGSAANPKKYARLNSSGSIEIINSAYSAVIFTFDNSGNLTAAANITAYSDVRLKTNIHPIQDAISTVNKINGVSYERISDGMKKIGFIAQDLQKVLPEVVIENHDGLLSIDYGNIVALLVEAIKEQQKQIDQLRKDLDSSKLCSCP